MSTQDTPNSPPKPDPHDPFGFVPVLDQDRAAFMEHVRLLLKPRGGEGYGRPRAQVYQLCSDPHFKDYPGPLYLWDRHSLDPAAEMTVVWNPSTTTGWADHMATALELLAAMHRDYAASNFAAFHDATEADRNRGKDAHAAYVDAMANYVRATRENEELAAKNRAKQEGGAS